MDPSLQSVDGVLRQAAAHPDDWQLLLETYERLSEWGREEAARLLDALEARFPEEPEVLFRLGSALSEESDPATRARGKAFLERLLAVSPDDAYVRSLLFSLEVEQGAWDRAERLLAPDTPELRELLLEHFGAQRFGGVHVERRIGDGGEFDALEAYEPGMDLRSVDWKASARHQALRVRRFRVEQNQRVIVCVDTGRLMAEPIDGLERLDHAIHASLLLAQVALRSGDLVGAHAYGAGVSAWVPPAGGMRQMTRLRHGLAGLSSAAEETNHVLGIRQLLTRLRRRSLIVVFSEFTDATTAELMVEHLGHLARRHLVIFVALDDPRLDSRAEVAPSTPEDLAATVVSTGLRHDRLRVLRRLKRMGVDVIHAPPGPAALALVARYVRAKRRSLIG